MLISELPPDERLVERIAESLTAGERGRGPERGNAVLRPETGRSSN